MTPRELRRIEHACAKLGWALEPDLESPLGTFGYYRITTPFGWVRWHPNAGHSFWRCKGTGMFNSVHFIQRSTGEVGRSHAQTSPELYALVRERINRLLYITKCGHNAHTTTKE